MASSDWTLIDDTLSSSSVKRGVTAGISPPNGGGSFVYGFASQDNTPGTVALYSTISGFDPLPKGGDIRAAFKRGQSAGPVAFSPFIFIGLGGTTSADVAYLLGWSDEDPSHVVLRKGPLSGGIPNAAPIPAVGNLGVIARSTASFAQDTYLQLRLEQVVNPNGDVVLNCYMSDPAVHAVSSPVWSAIPGIPQFIDDALGVNSGSAPFTSGRVGYGFVKSDVSRRGYFDQIQTFAQV